MNTAKQVGGALGLAVLVTVAATQSTTAVALSEAYRRAFCAIAAIMVAAAATAVLLPAHRDRR